MTAMWLPGPLRRRRDHAAASLARDRDDLLRLVAEGGCPVCRYRNDGLDAWLRAYAAESRTELDVQQRMAASLGPCPAHTRFLLVDGSASWLLKSVYLDVVSAGLARLTRRDQPELAECRLCAQERADERLMLARLVRALGAARDEAVADPTKVRDAYREAGGACLNHALDALQLADADTAGVIVDTLRQLLCGPADQTGGNPAAAAGAVAGIDLDVPLRVAMRERLAAESLAAEEDAFRRSVSDRVRADLAGGSCPVCRASQRAEWRFLRWAAAEVDRRPEEVTLCRAHLADLATTGPGAGADASPGAQAVLAANLDGWLNRLDRYDAEVAEVTATGTGRRRSSRVRAAATERLVESPTCRACEAAEITAHRTAQLLDAAATDPALTAELDAAHGVCLRHALAGEPATGRFRDVLAARLRLLHWSLEESLRKDRWTTRWDVRGAELAAWSTAPALVDGRAYAGHAPAAVRPCLHRPAR
jgi:hypothetical protein